MVFLFWTLWIFDLLLLLLAILGKGFRSSFGAGIDLNVVVIISLVLVLGGSLLLRFVLRQKGVSLSVAALPVLIVMGMYVWDKIKAGNSDAL